MRCYICDAELSDAEVLISEDPKHKFEPCKKCTDIINEAAYSDGFTPGRDPNGLLEFAEDDGQLNFPLDQEVENIP